MAIDIPSMIAWYDSNNGLLTYSMSPRYVIGFGNAGGYTYTDCSGGMTSALIHAGAQPAQNVGDTPAYSTVNLGGYLQQNGFTQIYAGANTGLTPMWNYAQGDVVLMSASQGMAGSGGAGGHVGMFNTDTSFVSVTYYRWSDGAGDVPGAAVQYATAANYFNILTSDLIYFEGWRLGSSGGGGTPPPPPPPPPPPTTINNLTPKSSPVDPNDPCAGMTFTGFKMLLDNNILKPKGW